MLQTSKKGIVVNMKKIIEIAGMNCGHCQATVEKALSAVEGVSSVKVDLKKKIALVEVETNVSDDILKEAVSNSGFSPISIKEKKGLFGN